MLHVSAASDTDDHSFLLDFLFLAFIVPQCPGFPPTSLSVFLTLFAGIFPDSSHLKHIAVPWGCVLGSFLFSLYSLPVLSQPVLWLF